MNNVPEQKGHLLMMILKDKIGNNKFYVHETTFFFIPQKDIKQCLEKCSGTQKQQQWYENIICNICYMFCDRNNSIVFRVARKFVKKRHCIMNFSTI